MIDMKSKADDKNLPAFTLDTIVKEANEMFGLTGDDVLNKETIRTRVKQGNPNGPTETFMKEIEPLLEAICLSCVDIGEPLDKPTFLELVNSLIKNTTPTQDKVKEWQQIHKKPMTGKLSTKYYSQFMKRHPSLKSAAANKKDINRKNWGTYTNISLMYDKIYDLLVQKGIAKKLETPKHLDMGGNEVPIEQAFGLPVEYKMLYPERLLHMDETGCNTNQKTDGRVGGKKYIGRSGNGKVSKTSSTTDKRFTLLPIINSLGEAVCCVTIFQGEGDSIPSNWITGIDIRVLEVLTTYPIFNMFV